MTDRPVRLALVGIGKIARDQHVPALARSPRLDLVATASHHGHVEGVPSFPSIEALLAAGLALDAVSIASPPLGRTAIAAAAVGAGLAVMLEKPPGATLSEVATLQAQAAAAGTSLFAAWHSREAAGVAAARAWLAGCAIRRVSIVWREDIRRWHPGQDWILAAGGFGVFDPGINALSIATFILPDPLEVRAAEFAVPAGRDAPLAATLRMASGAAEVVAEFDFLHQGEQQWDIVVETDRGRLTLRDGGKSLLVDGAGADGARVDTADEEYPRLYDRFADLVASGASDVDVAPLRLVADAYLLAVRRVLPAFAW